MTTSQDLNYLFRSIAISFIAMVQISVFAQGTPTIFDCLGAKPICDQIYKEAFFPRGEGNFTGEFNPEFSCLLEDNNAIWYTFITHRSGNLGFQITPDNSTDDLNWALFDITNVHCRDIFANPSTLLSCNSSSGDSCNGRTGADNSSMNVTQIGLCDQMDPVSGLKTTAWNAFIPVETNSIYALMISNATGTSGGFEIDFGLSDDVMLQDFKKPEINFLETDRSIGCIPNNIFIGFSEYIRCQSISRSNFKLTNDAGREFLIDLDAGSCNLDGEYDRFYVIALQEPLPAGSSYLLEITPNMSYPIVDLCGNLFSSFDYTFKTSINELEKINFPPDTSTCENTLTLDATDSNATDYSWSDGSTDSTLEITSGGLYFVTVSNPCESVKTSVNVSFANESDISFSLGRDTVICSDPPYLLNPNLNDNDLHYEWHNGEIKPTKEVNESGNYILKIMNDCGNSFIDSISVEFQNINLDLGPDTSICFENELTLDVASEHALTYQWSTGETTSSIKVSAGGMYNVLVSNECQTVADTIFLEEISCDDCLIYVPNVISTSAIGENNNFKMQSNCSLETYHLRIYNRWGSLLFETTSHSDIWNGTRSDGTIFSLGIYIYQLNYSIANNSEIIYKQVSGDVLLIE